MELIEFLRIIRKKVWLILLITTVVTAASAALSIFVITPVYEAKSQLIIVRAPVNQDDRLQYSDLLMYEQLVKTYSELAKSKPVVSQAKSKLGYDIKPRSFTVIPKSDTQIIEIRVQDEKPQEACEYANALSEAFIEKVKTMMNSDDVKVMEEAEVPIAPVKPNVILNIAIAFILGLMISITLVVLLDYLDNTLKTEDDIEEYLAMTVLASIPYEKKKRPSK